MESTTKLLDAYGKIAVEALKQDVQKVSATGQTADSIHYTVTSGQTTDRLQIFGRAFFSTLETGRGPRKSSQQGDFQDNMLEYMKARGIGADLDEKKRKQLARFFTWKINKEGDQTFKSGGRIVYSPTLTKLVDELKQAVLKDFKGNVIREIKETFKG